jgi:hypothetical protein
MATSAANLYADWLERYRRAWIERDADAASRLFTEDATYREQPFRYRQPVVHGNRLAVEWWANLQTNDGPLTLAGEFLLLFAENGDCRELREYWLLTQGRMEPAPGWGS